MKSLPRAWTRTAFAACAAVLGASGCAPGAEPFLADLDGTLGEAVSVGGYVYEWIAAPGGFALGALGLAVLALGFACGLVREIGPTRDGPASQSISGALLGGMGLALIAQQLLLSGWMLPGSVCYVGAGLVALRAPVPELPSAPRAGGLDFMAAAGGLVVFSVLALWQLDIRPELDFDEFAYLKAVLISLGDLPATEQIGRVYELARFEALPIALAWQSLWVGAVGPDVLSTRLASVVACGFALAASAIVLRAQLGLRTAALGLLLGATAPLLLAYARLGLQISGSILHGTVAIGLWLLVRARWSFAWGAALGAVLGASLFLYQLSWFVPVLALPALGLAAWRDGGPTPKRVALVVVLVAGFVAGTGVLLLRSEFTTLWGQTESRRTWEGESRDRTGGQQRFILPQPVTTKEARRAAHGIHADGVETWMGRTDSGAYVLGMIGDAEARAPLTAQANASGWRPLSAAGVSPLAALSHTLGFLFRDAHLQNPDALIDAPTLRPLLAPLLVVGLVRLFRRRTTRALAWWILGATFVPVLLAGSETRRIVLAVPLLVGVAAWPLGELAFGLGAQRARRPRAALAAGTLLLCAVLMASGLYLSVERWDQRVEITRTPVRMLELARVLAQLPEEERVLIPRGLLTSAFGQTARLAAGLTAGPEAIERFVPVGAAEVGGPHGLRRASCAERLPFTWVLPASEEAQVRFEGLDRDFVLERRQVGEVQLLRVVARRGEGCAR